MAFSADGRLFLSADHTGLVPQRGNTGSVRFWRAPTPVSGDPRRVALWAQVFTGMELGPDGQVRVLDAVAWRQRKEQLAETGGSPLLKPPLLAGP